MSRLEALRVKVRELEPDLDRARELVTKADAEGRPLTEAERAIFDPNMKRSDEIITAVKQAKADEALMAMAREFAGAVGGPAGKSDDRRLSFKGMGGRLATNMLGGGGFTKALAPSGAAVVGQEFKTRPGRPRPARAGPARRHAGGAARHTRIQLSAAVGADERRRRRSSRRREAHFDLHHGPRRGVARRDRAPFGGDRPGIG